MGTFVTQDTTPTIFPDGDKSAAPGVSIRPGWTSDNVLTASEMNTIKDALLDCRTAIRAGPGGQTVMGYIAYSPDVEYQPGGDSPTTWTPTADTVDQLVEFSKVLVNEGGFYEPTLSAFIAPVAGIYAFTATIVAVRDTGSSESYFTLALTKNTNSPFARFVRRLQSSDPSTREWFSASITGMVSLAERDTVDLRLGTSGVTATVMGGLYTTFSGQLLKVT